MENLDPRTRSARGRYHPDNRIGRLLETQLHGRPTAVEVLNLDRPVEMDAKPIENLRTLGRRKRAQLRYGRTRV